MCIRDRDERERQGWHRFPEQMGRRRGSCVTVSPPVVALVAEHDHGPYAEGEQMREEEDDRDAGEQWDDQCDRTVAQEQPQGDCRQRQAEAEEVVQKPPQENAVIKKELAKQWPWGPATVQGIVQSDGAAHQTGE